MAGYNDEKPASLLTRARPWLYGFVFVLIFALTGTELGLVSHILHTWGNNPADYPTAEFKNILGLMLFTCIASILYIISHPWSSVGFSAFWTLVFGTFWATSAGVLNRVVPFEVSKCAEPASDFLPVWTNWLSWCHELVALQGIAWALWGIYMIKLVGMLMELFELRRKHPKPFYERV